MVMQCAEETGAIVVAENNVKFGGLGSAVAEVLVANNPIPMRQIGVDDTFAESGPYLEVIDKYGLTSPHIIKAAKEVLEHKERFFSRNGK
jgi:transketolase